jgi:cytochrome b561
MTYGTRTDHYPASSKLLHWLVAICVLTTAPVAIAMTRVGEGPTQDVALGAPIADPAIEPWQKAVSAAVHTSFYVLLIAMPIVGYIANSAYGAPTPFFGLLELPPIVEKNEALSTPLFAIHRWVGWLLIILVLTHVSAALYHHFIRGDNVLQRMLPRALGGSEVAGPHAVHSAAVRGR